MGRLYLGSGHLLMQQEVHTGSRSPQPWFIASMAICYARLATGIGSSTPQAGCQAYVLSRQGEAGRVVEYPAGFQAFQDAGTANPG